jgi:hypothetical protein
MRNLHELDQHRVRHYSGTMGNGNMGAFVLFSDKGVELRIIATNAEGWDHVSVSTPSRCPTWEEMEFVKRLFFGHNECAMQLHVPPAEHINCHPYTLHLWRPHLLRIPRPPARMI